MRIVAVIPARGGSERLPRKNVTDLLGKPLVAWTIDAALSSRHLGASRVFVSTEDPAIAAVARSSGARVVARPAELAGPDVWTEPVIQHAVETIEAEESRVDIVVWINASLPELTSADIDAAVDLLLEGDVRETIAVDMSGRSTSAVRAMRRDVLFQHRLSVRFAVIELDYVDIHTPDDLVDAERRLLARTARSAAAARP